jgi:hypothetical protein
MKFFNPVQNQLIAKAIDVYSELAEAAMDNYYAEEPNTLSEIRQSNKQQSTSAPNYSYSSPRPS